MASTKKRAAQSAASVSNAELPAVKDDILQQEAEKPKEDLEPETGDKEPKEESIKDSDNYSEYKMVAGTYHRTEGGRRVRYTVGDTVSLTSRQARKLRGSVKKLVGG